MKNILLIVLACMASAGYARAKADKEPAKLTYSAADSVITNIEKKTIRLFGKAEFQYGNVHFIADEIFINRETGKVIATGLIAFSVPKVNGDVNSIHKILTYTMGDDAVLML